jgi:hypothetical protein
MHSSGIIAGIAMGLRRSIRLGEGYAAARCDFALVVLAECSDA